MNENNEPLDTAGPAEPAEPAEIKTATFEDGQEPPKDDVTPETKPEPQTVENADDGVKLSEEGKPFDELTAEEKANHAFVKKQRELKEAQAKEADTQRKLSEAQAKINELSAKKRPEVPDVPSDPYDPDFQQKMAYREEKLKEQERFDAEQEFKQRQEEDKIKQAQAINNEKILKMQNEHRKRASDLGIEKEELDKTEDFVSMYVTDKNIGVVPYVLNHPEGPLIVKYLGANPAMLDEMSRMDTAQATALIIKKIEPNLSSLKPKPSAAPKPVETLDGKTPPEKDHPALEGAIFE